MRQPQQPISVLFVCMGNICRSPSAEGFFQQHVMRAGLEDTILVDSAGTHGYHIGSPPDPRAVAEAQRHGIHIGTLRARKVTDQDFSRFQHIVAMDHNNLKLLQDAQNPGTPAQLSLMMSFSERKTPREVPDPYYGSQEDFNYMCHLLHEATLGLLEHLQPGAVREGI